MGATALPTGAVLLIALLGAVLLASASAAWRASRAARRSGRALAEERARHASTRDEVRRFEALDLTARRLAGARTAEEVADLAGAAATELLGAQETVLVLRAADDLLITRTAVGGGQAADTRDVEIQGLAERALQRGVTLREEPPGTSGGAEEATPAPERTELAIPLRDAEQLLGALVLRGLPAAASTGPVDVVVAERLAGHVTQAVVRAQQDRVMPRLQPGPSGDDVPVQEHVDLTAVPDGDDAAVDPPAPPATPAASEAAGTHGAYGPSTAPVVADLSSLVRSGAADARARAAVEGAPRRVAVLAPSRAGLTLPEAALSELIAAVFSLILDRTEPGSNLAVEVLAMEGGWEWVVTHAGAPIDEGTLAAAGLPERLSRVSGDIESGEGAGVSRVRVRLPELRAVPVGGPPAPATADT